MNLNTHEATDRRIVFELTGHKLDENGVFREEDEDIMGEKMLDPSTVPIAKIEYVTVNDSDESY